MSYDWYDETLEGFNGYTASRDVMPAYEGGLYIFPSWLEHYVSPNMSQDKRISISFNMVG